MIRCILLAALAALPVSVSAVTFNLVAQDLKEANGALMRVGGLVVLVASTTDNEFAEIQPDTVLQRGFSFSQNDDLVLERWETPTLGSLGDQEYQEVMNSVSSLWTPGDLLRLYWFPTLTLSDTQAGEGSPYGFFPNHAPGSDEPSENDWVTPADSAVHELTFLTLNHGGDQPVDRGIALAVVPEPSFYAGMFAAGCLAWAAVSRRKKSRAA